MLASVQLFFHLTLKDKTLIKFIIGVIFGLAFSITSILGTIGIMDGFVTKLRGALKKSTGDLYFYARDGFFRIDEDITEALDGLEFSTYTAMIKSQGFAISGDIAKGVLVLGIDNNSYYKTIGINVELGKNEVALGEELSKRLNVVVNDQVVLALAKGNKDFKNLPLLYGFKIRAIIKHDIHKEDARTFYTRRVDLARLMNIKNKINYVAINLNENKLATKEHTDLVKNQMRYLSNELGYGFAVRPYWNEFSSLLEAIKTEKFLIGLILQLIVVISVINVLAFIIFINEKRSRELFLFKALGLGQRKLTSIWIFLVIIFWFFSCLTSLFLVKILDLFLNNFSYFERLSEIYNLGTLSLTLKLEDYLLVFFLTLIWLLVVSWLGLRRIRKRSILEGLRKEFA